MKHRVNSPHAGSRASDTVAGDTEVGLFDGGHDGEHNACSLVETSKRSAAQGDFFMVIAPRQQDNVT